MTIALVAHDSRKKELLEWVKFNRKTLFKSNIVCTGTTGKLVRGIFVDYFMESSRSKYERSYWEEVAHHNIQCFHSGPLGGDSEIGAAIANGKIDVLIFFCDNLITQGHQVDISALSRLASLYNIAFATNRTTADMILTSTLFNNKEYKRIKPDFTKYLTREICQYEEAPSKR